MRTEIKRNKLSLLYRLTWTAGLQNAHMHTNALQIIGVDRIFAPAFFRPLPLTEQMYTVDDFIIQISRLSFANVLAGVVEKHKL